MTLENNGSVLEETVPAAEETVTPAETVEAPDAAEAAEPVEVPEAEAPAEAVAEPVSEPAVAEPAPVEPKKKPAKKHKKPHIAIRIPLQLISLVLCIALLAALVVTAVVADLRQIQSKDGIKQIISAIFEQPRVMRPISGAAGVRLTAAMPDLTGGDEAIVDWLMLQIETQYGDELPVDREDVETFLEESTITDYVTDKIASYTEDFITGETNTTITPEEIEQLIDENKELIEQTFQVEITEEITNTITSYVEEADINTVIQKEVFESLGKAPVGVMPELPQIPGITPDLNNPDSDGTENQVTVNDLLDLLQQITADQVMHTLVGICAGLVLLLLLCNFYSIPGGLGWASAPTIFAGLLLSLPVYFLSGSPETLTMLLHGDAMVANVILGLLSTIAPVHYTVLGIGLGLAALSIVVRIIRAVVRKNKLKTA